MTKAEIIKQISAETGIEGLAVRATVESFIRTVTVSMTAGENVYIRGFGSFVNKCRARRVARNISKNTALVIEPHYTPAFKPAKQFAEHVRKHLKVSPNKG